jgi:hypothetical protein
MSGLPKEVEEALLPYQRAIERVAESDWVSRGMLDERDNAARALRSAILAALAAARAEAVEQAAICAHVVVVGPTRSTAERCAAADIESNIRSLLPAPKQGDNERERA